MPPVQARSCGLQEAGVHGQVLGRASSAPPPLGCGAGADVSFRRRARPTALLGAHEKCFKVS